MQISRLSDVSLSPRSGSGSGEATPQLICLDAVGTLFGVRASVGTQYQAIARQFGVACAAEALDAAFYGAFKAAPKAAFPDLSSAQRRSQEYAWWRAIAAQTFQTAGYWNAFTDFEAYFQALFAYFATAEPWILYPEVIPTLEQWQRCGVQLAIISNFDSRLYPVLVALGLAPFFSSVTISTEAGWAKPEPEIFAIALAKHACAASAAWHIGDSRSEDYEAAQACGLKGIWLCREPTGYATNP